MKKHFIKKKGVICGLSILFATSALASTGERLEVKNITTNVYEASQILGIQQREGHTCGLFDMFWCPKFSPSDDVYVTEMKFTDGTRFILNLTENQNTKLEKAVNSRTHPIIDLSGCAREDLPFDFTCKYRDIKFVN